VLPIRVDAGRLNPIRSHVRILLSTHHGDCVGASGEVTVAAGLGANVLVGGSNRTVALQPISLGGQTGLNVAIGVATLHLGLPRQMTDVFTLLGSGAFFRTPFRNSISSACRPTMRSNATILASYSWSRSAAWASSSKAPLHTSERRQPPVSFHQHSCRSGFPRLPAPRRLRRRRMPANGDWSLCFLRHTRGPRARPDHRCGDENDLRRVRSIWLSAC
jgi:hypothetical protein